MFPDCEVVVVDDGSTDGTWDELQSVAAPFTALRQENRGPSAARNAGARIARGTYLAFLDSDDELLAPALETYARAIEASGSPSVVSGCLLEFRDSEPRPAAATTALSWRHFANYFEAASEGIYVGAGMLVVRRELLLAAGGFNEDIRVAEDHDLMLRLGRAAGFVRIESPATIARRRHAGSISDDGAHLYRGLATLVRRVEQGEYGRGDSCLRPARAIVSAHARCGAIRLSRSRQLRNAARLYWRSLAINACERHWRFIAGFPLLLAWHAVAGCAATSRVAATA
jgi:glycosyltransferase involved in cell wall biosynthesis